MAGRRAPAAYPRCVGTGEAVPARVESPFQLLGALEAHASGVIGAPMVVLPRPGVEPISRTVRELRRLGMPPGVRVGAPGPVPRRVPGPLALGDALSGEVQRLLVTGAPEEVLLLDDGRATRRVLDALLGSGVPLLRPHVPASPARMLLARSALFRLRRLLAERRLTLLTAVPLPADTRHRAWQAGLAIRTHDFGWLRSLPAEPTPDAELVVLGSSMVATGLIGGGDYLAWLRGLATSTGRILYCAHRREDARTLGPLSAIPGLQVRSDGVPVELALRAMPPGQRVVTLPSTAAGTLRLIAPRARVQELAVPGRWWLPGVPAAARRLLVPDPSGSEPRVAGSCWAAS